MKLMPQISNTMSAVVAAHVAKWANKDKEKLVAWRYYMVKIA